MKTLHRYLLRQVLASLVMTVAVFTFVLLLGNLLREILGLLVNRQASLGMVLEAVGLLIPFVWPFALPMGMLTATLLVFGRFSADQELTAARASGISLVSLVAPILWLSLLLCGVSAYINFELSPRSRVAYRELILRVVERVPSIVLPEGQRVDAFKGYVFFVGRNRYPDLADVFVWKLDAEDRSELKIYAPRGQIHVDLAREKMTLDLFDAVAARRVDEDWVPSGYAKSFTQEFDLSPEARSEEKKKICNMTFRELEAERQTWEAQRLDPTPVLMQMHARVASAFACFGFALVGIPLGIRVHRRETNIGVAIGLVLVLLYYSFFLVAQSLSSRPEFVPYLIVWLPNFIFQVVGAVLLWRANRGG